MAQMFRRYGNYLCGERRHRLFIPIDQRITWSKIVWSVPLNHTQYCAPEKHAAALGHGIPCTGIEEIHPVCEGEIETTGTVAVFMSLAQFAQGGSRFLNGITSFRLLRH